MGKKKHEEKPGYGKLLDAWVAPDDAGEPIGCVATSFTFSPVFFEEECLACFLQLESDPTEDGPVYLVEREEQLAQVACAAALVDQHHCKGGRSLRWDLLSARMPSGLQHAKVSLLFWSKLVRVIISSANLTDDGYRRNLELFGVLDHGISSEAPVACLHETVDFLRRAAEYSTTSSDQLPAALLRWNALLDRVADECNSWGLADAEIRRRGVRVQPVFSGPDDPSVFDSLGTLWPGGSPPDLGLVISPFFDRPEVKNAPAQRLWGLLRQRGEPLAASCTALSTTASPLVPRCGPPLRLRYGLRSAGLCGLRPYLMELRSTRKPMKLSRLTVVPLLRSAERQLSELRFQLPPRITRVEPDAAPVGSVVEPLG